MSPIPKLESSASHALGAALHRYINGRSAQMAASTEGVALNAISNFKKWFWSFSTASQIAQRNSANTPLLNGGSMPELLTDHGILGLYGSKLDEDSSAEILVNRDDLAALLNDAFRAHEMAG